MIDITRSQANQYAVDGVNTEWTVTLDGEELYTLPAYIKPQDVFVIRNAIEKMMKRAAADMKLQEEQLCLVKMDRLCEHGDAKLDALKAENERLANIIENLTNGEVA